MPRYTERLPAAWGADDETATVRNPLCAIGDHLDRSDRVMANCGKPGLFYSACLAITLKLRPDAALLKI
jgi:hypothetical protein